MARQAVQNLKLVAITLRDRNYIIYIATSSKWYIPVVRRETLSERVCTVSMPKNMIHHDKLQ